MLKNIVILGSSGSIGLQTIDVVKRYPELFNVVGLAVNKSIDALEQQIKELRPKAVVVVDAEKAQELSRRIAGTSNIPELLTSIEGLEQLAAHPEADLVLNALVGSVGLRPTLAALRAGKTLALANKESMVAGGAIVAKVREETGAEILPVDSEHNAIFQCMVGERKREIKRLIVTASGGPFRGRTFSELESVTVEEALKHPRWTMGPKITIDSATLMNKGLEVIEAHWLFDLPYEQIDVIVHPQSIIHSMVEFEDGSIKAHLGQTDMRIPIQYTLSYPDRLPAPLPSLDFVEVGKLTFEKPDMRNFPCLAYAYEAIRLGKTYPAVLNATNEQAVAAFLSKKIRFTDIPNIIKQVIERHEPGDETDLGIVLETEHRAREYADRLITSLIL
ncbi:MAG: 1-deoxy-D-xylulose-5-phosphate reductoisomerase [Candidatus Aquicultor secundus]|uniref:1-deoxy-D-xylulose-5-phosphate reductoisomerase n=1 Tax=Candidatus Aquicultor secundus TaxID=1973895 RepID=UPI00090F5F25|nr:MAG: 1-deoxy-D-xylulose-5-phosphate reductoisomerase [Candidatus Aquicultor secundus]PIU26924.1 MAG: 1-deoxy-D-xylulose-5-phosphate reductoisomerase [Candidatus Aquicultor secundus]PJB76436.1 MAG: 1-deoxy-D-xylulose-5-phosphate reductoisomerase [Candidatus Aquicultor secundus]